jgi:hypothetical protein
MNNRRSSLQNLLTSSYAQRQSFLFAIAVLSIALMLQSCRVDVRTETQRADEAHAARRADDDRLFKLATVGSGNPEHEAAIAAARGDFRFVGHSLLVPGIFPAAYGVECRPPINILKEALSRATYAGSDMPPVNETEAAERTRSSDNHATFGLRYNRALLADARFPYDDMCRLSMAQQTLTEDFTKPVDYGFRDLMPIERPANLGEAARRGTAQSLTALIASRRGELNKRDTFGMTPLSWAIAYGRREHAQLLMKSGALALPTPNVVNDTDPVRLARDKGWRDMVASMLSTLNAKEKEVLVLPPELKRQDRTFVNALDQLKLSRSPQKTQDAIYVVRLQISSAGKVNECSVDPGRSDSELAKRLCKIILKTSRWTPARNGFGDGVSGAATLRLRVPPDGD